MVVHVFVALASPLMTPIVSRLASASGGAAVNRVKVPDDLTWLSLLGLFAVRRDPAAGTSRLLAVSCHVGELSRHVGVVIDVL